MMGVIAVAIVAGIVSMVFYALVQGALVRATIAHTEGRRASFGESAAAGLAVALPLIGLSILAAIGIWLGLILLIVPGIMLFCMWRSEEHTSELQSLMRISYAVLCLKKKQYKTTTNK